MLKYLPLAAGIARCPGATIQEIVHRRGRCIPPVLESQSYAFLGDADIPFERYTSRVYFEREMFDQDTTNMRFQQEGLEVSRKRGATSSSYQEIRIRHLHHTHGKYCGKDP